MSEPVRLVVSDVDGTLVDKDKKLTPGTVAAVERLRAAGVGFTIISARPRSGMMPIADTLAIDDPMGAFNGGTIFRRDGTVMVQHRIDPQLVAAMFEIVGDAPVDRWLFADDRWYASSAEGHHVDSERVASNQAPIVTRDFAPLFDRADKITFVSDDPALLAGLHDRASAAIGTRATVVQSQTYYLDVTALAANKGDGVTLLASAMHTPLTELAVIGDQANDVAMFERAGLSVAMGQGPIEVRDQADFTTASNDADGVARAIDAIILPRTG
ncbi:Cof-type HAD-IIB family hydrolase [Sphingomonas oligophenolica]|uniref:Cof-type HAD-IIB family hydrolase n=1 Tax=Sphingomonas oligophenolica TaxID=301154 RepID=A0ABU9Y625_9SPHN